MDDAAAMSDTVATRDTLVPHARFVEVRERRQRMMTAFTALSTAITSRHDADTNAAPTVDSEPPTGVLRESRSVIDMRRADPYVGGDHTLF